MLQKNRLLTEDFTKLFLELKSEGLFEPSYVKILLRTIDILVTGLIGYYLLCSTNYMLKSVGVVLLGLAQGRCGWVQHEGGHYSLSGNPKVDRFLQIIFMGKQFKNFVLDFNFRPYKLSLVNRFRIGIFSRMVEKVQSLALAITSYTDLYSSQHNRHHAAPQRLHYDVDLNTMPFVAYNSKIVKNSKDGKGFMIQNQVDFYTKISFYVVITSNQNGFIKAYLFLLVDTFLLNVLWHLYLHPKFVYQRKNFLEMLAMIGHWLLLCHIGFWPAILSSWFKAVYLIINFSLNHTFLPVTTEPTHWVEYSLHHTADVEHTMWCNYWMAYLNYQIEHHLFPTMPQYRHPLITDRVKALAKKHNLPYIVHSYPVALWKVFQNLLNVSKELKSL